MKDVRSVKKWCQCNSVALIKQGKSWFAPLAQFQTAFYKPLIAWLKTKFHDQWKVHFDALQNNDINVIIEHHEAASGKSQKLSSLKLTKTEEDYIKKLNAL